MRRRLTLAILAAALTGCSVSTGPSPAKLCIEAGGSYEEREHFTGTDWSCTRPDGEVQRG